MKHRYFMVFIAFVYGCFSTGVPENAFSLDKGKKRDVKIIDTIIIHAIGGPDESCPNNKFSYTPAGKNASFWKEYFNNHKSVSIHYIVDREGKKESSLKEDEIAIHAGNSNGTSIGIELVNNGDGIEEYTDSTITALVGLIKEIQARYKIPVENIKGHEMVDQSKFTCGGKEYKRKVDPGSKFPWIKIEDSLR